MTRAASARGALALVFGLASVVVAVVGTDRAAGASLPSPTRVRRLLVLTLPAVTWNDLESTELPHLQSFFEHAAVGSLSLRAVHPVTRPTEGYVTLGAGTRALGDDPSGSPAAAVDPGMDGEDPRRRPGQPGEAPATVYFSGLSVIIRENRRWPYGAVPGALGEALQTAGVGRAVIANADTSPLSVRPSSYGRDAVAGLMDRSGRVPGVVTRDLLVRDAAAPFGVAYRPSAVVASFDRLWRDRTVVLVEASDLARVDATPGPASGSQRRALLRRALSANDEVFGDLLTRVGDDDAVLVITPFHSRLGVHLGIAALRAPGMAPGLLRSAITRRPGFVTSTDFAPTVLSLFGVTPPASMEGRPFVVGPGGGFGQRRQFLLRSDGRARFRDGLVAPVTALFVFGQLGLALVAVRVVRRGGEARRMRVAALTVLFVAPATYATGLLPMERLGRLGFAVFVLGMAALGATLVERLAGRRPAGGLPLALAAVVAFLLGDVLTGARLQFDTPFGYSPIVAGRFAGFGNLAFAEVAAASILLAGLCASCRPTWRGRGAAIGVLAGVLVVDGMPMWGAKVGSVLVSVPAFGVTGLLLCHRRIRVLTVVGLVGALALALSGFALVDLARPAASQTHLARLVEAVNAQGWSAFSLVVVRKASENLAILRSSVWALMLPIAVGVALFLLFRQPWPLRRTVEGLPGLRGAFTGLSVAAVLGFAFNDSGIAVPGMMLGIVVPATIYLSFLHPKPNADCEESPGRS